MALVVATGCDKLISAYCPALPPPNPPGVIGTSPDRDVSGVAIDRNITATFSQPMAHSTLTAANFTVWKGSVPVEGRVELTGSHSATFKPREKLEKGTTYTATIAAGVKDSSGGTMDTRYEWNFTTIQEAVALIVLEDNHFEFDKAAITKQGVEILDDNIRILRDNPSVRIRIAGYTSAQGTAAYNQKLSEQRAEAVKNYLVKGGVAADRLVTIGYGRTRPAEFEPIPENIYSKQAKANMRVLFDVIVK